LLTAARTNWNLESAGTAKTFNTKFTNRLKKCQHSFTVGRCIADNGVNIYGPCHWYHISSTRSQLWRDSKQVSTTYSIFNWCCRPMLHYL